MTIHALRKFEGSQSLKMHRGRKQGEKWVTEHLKIFPKIGATSRSRCLLKIV